MTYTVTPDAYVQTELTYDPVEELGDMPEFGILFKLNADYDRMEWYGLGPQETYADAARSSVYIRIAWRIIWRSIWYRRSAATK